MPIGNPVTLTSNVASKTISVTATASQTLFNVTGGYRINSLGVFKNGLRLQDGVDYTARDGLTVTLLSAASGGDKLQFVVFDTFRVAEAIRPNVDDQTIRGNLRVVGILSASTLEGLSNFNLTSGITTFNDVRVGGALTVAGALTFEDVTNIDSVGIITAQSHVSIADSILHTGDTDTSIRFPAADTFTVETAGSERVRVTSGGSVGINTTSPSATFEVASTGEASINIVADSDSNGSNNDSLLNFRTNGNSGTAKAVIKYDESETNFGIETNGSRAVSIDSSQRLMVGQTSPYAATGAGSTIATFTDSGNYRTNLVVSNQTNGTDSGSAVVLAAHGNDWIIEAKGLAKGQRSLAINAGSTEALRVNFDGNVGIGTTIAGGKLQIDGGELLVGTKTVKNIASTTNATAIFRDDSGSHTIIAVESHATAGGGVLALSASRNNTDNGFTIVQDADVLGEIRFAGDDGTNLQHAGARIIAEVDGTPAEDDMPGILKFLTNPGGTATAERLRIGKSGHVSIGGNYTQTTYELQVTGTINATTDVKINGTSAATTGKAIAMAMLFG